MTAAYNLGVVMRMLFGIGTSRSLQGMMGAILACFMSSKTLWCAIQTARSAPYRVFRRFRTMFRGSLCEFQNHTRYSQIAISSTGC